MTPTITCSGCGWTFSDPSALVTWGAGVEHESECPVFGRMFPWGGDPAEPT